MGVGLRFLGIDPASKKCGYGVVDLVDGRLAFVDAGVLVASERKPPYTRIAEIGIDLELVIAEFKPNAVGLEAGFVQRVNGALTLGAARGVCAFIAIRAGLEVREYAPKTVKLAVAGRGDAEKPEVAMIVAQLLGLRVTPGSDAGDALAVAITRARDVG